MVNGKLFWVYMIIACMQCAIAGNNHSFYFNRYGIENGLTQNTVFSIMQDKTGFMWFGTKDGLNRFDGVEFKTFIKGGSGESEYDCSFVSSLYQTDDGNIWIGTDRGICIYDPVSETVSPFRKKTDNGVRITNPVGYIVADGKGSLFILVDGQGIFRYNLMKQHLTTYNLSVNGLEKITLTGLVFSDSGRIWIGSFGNGLFYTDDNFKTIHQFSDSEGKEPFSHCVISKIEEHNGLMYVAVESQGLRVIDLATRKVSDIFTKDERGGVPYVRDFLFSEGKAWIGTENGLYVYDFVTKHYQHYRHSLFDKYSLSDNAVYTLFKDREDGMWIGTYFGGVSYLPGKPTYFDKYYQNDINNFHGQQVREFCVDRFGKIWIGTEDAGLNKFDPEKGTFKYIEESKSFNNIHGLCADGDNLWVGTFSHGLKLIDMRSDRIVKSFNIGDGSELNSNYVFTVCRTRKNDIYIGTMSGLQRYDRQNGKFITIPELRNIFIYDIMEDLSGDLWVATYVNGLYRYDAINGLWKRYINIVGDSHSIPNNRVFSIYQDSRHKIWVMTQSGICGYNPKTDNFDRTVDGIEFPVGVVYQMREDRLGNYWITTNHGLYNVLPGKQKVYKYTVNDGLLSNQFNYCSSCETSDGRIYFGCIGGFVSFTPQQFVAAKKLPSPAFVDFWVNNVHVMPGSSDSPLEESITLTKELNLSCEQNSIAFKVVSLSYSNLAKRRIKYKLEGVDDDWNYLPANSRIAYSNLVHGTYTLKVVSFNESAEDEGSVTELKIVIHPPFYLSVWAYIFYAIIIVVSTFYLLKFLRLRNERRNNIAMEKYKQEKEKEVYDAKFEFFTNVAHEIRTPLTLIKAPLENVLHKDFSNDSSVKEDLDVMNMNVDRLLVLTNQLLDFQKIESKKIKLKKERCNVSQLVRDMYIRFQPTAESSNLKFELQLPKKDLFAVVDEEAVTKIISNLFTNALKYSETYIHASLKLEKDGIFTFTVSNDGAVISASQRKEVFSAFTRLKNGKNDKGGVGIGLSFAHNLAVLHGGTLSIVDSDKENIFVLSLPVEADISQEETAAQISDDSLDSIIKRSDTKSNVLLVEDSLEMCRFIEKQLIESNYNVFVAANGKEAIDILSDRAVDIIISDIMMPEMNGYELLEKVKTDLMYCHIPVILLTAKTDLRDKIEGLELGADAYIDKPFSMKYLLANISALLKNSARLRESLSKSPFADNEKNGGLSKIDKEFLSRLNKVIQENYSNPDFSMDEVVEIMNMSRSSFYRKMKGILDLSPNDYIRIERLKKAAELLKEGKYNVTEICYMVGFSSPSYFAKCFHKQYGVLPKDYV